MNWVDLGIGVCPCGDERRLYAPELEPVPPRCSVCVSMAAKKAEWDAVLALKDDSDWALELVPSEPPKVIWTPAHRREYQRKRREALKAAGQCFDCKAPAPDHARCPPCHAKMLIRTRMTKGRAAKAAGE